MLFTDKDKIIIKYHRIDKDFGFKRLLSEIPNKVWFKGGWRKLLDKTDSTESVKRRIGYVRPNSAKTYKEIRAVTNIS